MRRIYLVRHGLPEKGTSEKVYIGVTDVPLSRQGSAEARELGRYFLQRLSATSAVRILTSPLQRCRQTAEEMAARYGVAFLYRRLGRKACSGDQGTLSGRV